MSKITLTGNVSGTGTFTIASPNSNNDRTLNLPDNSGTVLTTATPGVPVDGPAFSAYTNIATTMTSSYTRYKISLNLEVFDTASAFNNTGSVVGSAPAYSFNPQLAGYYAVSFSAATQGTSETRSYVYKNGSVYAGGAVVDGSGFGGAPSTGSTIMYLNGSTDYVELYIESSVSSQTSDTGSSSVYLCGALVRAA
jgi:hypothetical protein